MRMKQIDDITKTELSKQTMKEVLQDDDDNLMLEFWLATWDILKQIISYLWTIIALVVSYLAVPFIILISCFKSSKARESIFTCGRTKHKKKELSKEFK